MAMTPIEEYIRLRAPLYGIDPDIAVRVAESEGGLTDPVRQSDVVKNGRRERSYGPYQLYMDGGLGNRALAAGIDPRKPEHWRSGVDFALSEAGNKGWGQWFGAAKVGIGEWDGIKGAGDRGGSPANPQMRLPGDSMVPRDHSAQVAAQTGTSLSLPQRQQNDPWRGMRTEDAATPKGVLDFLKESGKKLAGNPLLSSLMEPPEAPQIAPMPQPARNVPSLPDYVMQFLASRRIT